MFICKKETICILLCLESSEFCTKNQRPNHHCTLINLKADKVQSGECSPIHHQLNETCNVPMSCHHVNDHRMNLSLLSFDQVFCAKTRSLDGIYKMMDVVDSEETSIGDFVPLFVGFAVTACIMFIAGFTTITKCLSTATGGSS